MVLQYKQGKNNLFVSVLLSAAIVCCNIKIKVVLFQGTNIRECHLSVVPNVKMTAILDFKMEAD